MEMEIKEYDKFDDMELDELLLMGIYAHGFEIPSAIQKRAIIPFKSGRNVIAQAQSGTGKTGAFTISVLSRINTNINECQAVIIAPTRELAIQIHSVMTSIGKKMLAICHLSVGGTSSVEDEKNLRNGVHIVIGTPGRIYDMMKKGAINGEKVKMIILDEADEMLAKEGFQDIVYDILCEFNRNILQVGLFSATMPPGLLTLANKFVENPVKIIVKNEELTLEGILQYYIDLEEDMHKMETICDLYKEMTMGSCVIFCNSQKRVDFLTESLRRKDFSVESIHGSMDPKERTRIMNKFRTGGCNLLITTDLLARGIDVQHVGIVINHDLPKNIENYLHRIGRSGRYGRKGLAINFVTSKDHHQLVEIEKFYNTQICELPSNINKLFNAGY